MSNLRALAEAATPGPMTVRPLNPGPYGAVFFGDSHYNVRSDDPSDPERGPHVTTSGVNSAADAAYIAAASPDRILALLDANEQLRKAAETVVDAMTHAHSDDRRYAAVKALRAVLGNAP